MKKLLIGIILLLTSNVSAESIPKNPYINDIELCTVRIEYNYPEISSVMAACMDCANGEDKAVAETLRMIRNGYFNKIIEVENVTVYYDNCKYLSSYMSYMY